MDLATPRARVPRPTARHERPRADVSLGTSGHRGSSLRGSFNEAHILAITQAISEYRRGQGTDGPLYLGKDTHALSTLAQSTALEVLAANGVETVIEGQCRRDVHPRDLTRRIGLQPRPQAGRRRRDRRHPLSQPSGGRRASNTTRRTEDRRIPRSRAGSGRANALLRAGNAEVKRVAYHRALAARPPIDRTCSRPTSRTCATSSTWMRSGPRA